MANTVEQTTLEVEQSNLETSANVINKFIHSILNSLDIPEAWINLVNCLIMIAASIAIVFILQKVVNKLLTFVLQKAEKITSLSLFKYAINNKFPHYLALVVPYSFVITAIPIVFEEYKVWISPLLKLADIYFVFMVIWTIMAVIKSLVNVLQEKPAFHNKPMQSYLQVIQIIFYIFGAVAIFSILTGKSATTFFAAMGAASAVLMLMFKDSIMGLVSSIQISTNQMVMLGDWITMNKYGADGSVLEINLTTVKVQNFDKTITTIPTYALISDSFQNWRGMQESGARRVKRAIYIKQSDIRNLTDQELDDFAKIDGLGDYIAQKREAFGKINSDLNIKSESVAKFQLTNCDLFMHHTLWYLRNNPEIHQGMTLIVRQLAPTTQGLPIELYAFTATTAWVDYERITSEVQNHVISSVGLFGLTIFEIPAGSDPYDVYIKQNSNKQL